jgi:hypothetical protein
MKYVTEWIQKGISEAEKELEIQQETESMPMGLVEQIPMLGPSVLTYLSSFLSTSTAEEEQETPHVVNHPKESACCHSFDLSQGYQKKMLKQVDLSNVFY